MANSVEVYYSAGFRVVVDEEDLSSAYRRLGGDPDLANEDIATEAAEQKLRDATEGRIGVSPPEREDIASLGRGSVDWNRVRGGQAAIEGARKQAAESNPVTQQANDALKIAKVLSNLLNELAGLDQVSREQIATAAGLQQLPESIDKLYELADQMRMGGVQNLQVQVASYCGWDPDQLMRKAKPFVSLKENPVEEYFEPEEKFQAPNQEAKSAHEPECLMEKP
jgi:hypothetical protein